MRGPGQLLLGEQQQPGRVSQGGGESDVDGDFSCGGVGRGRE